LFAEQMKQSLEKYPLLEVLIAQNEKETMNAVKKTNFNLIILDLLLPDKFLTDKEEINNETNFTEIQSSFVIFNKIITAREDQPFFFIYNENPKIKGVYEAVTFMSNGFPFCNRNNMYLRKPIKPEMIIFEIQ